MKPRGEPHERAQLHIEPAGIDVRPRDRSQVVADDPGRLGAVTVAHQHEVAVEARRRRVEARAPVDPQPAQRAAQFSRPLDDLAAGLDAGDDEAPDRKSTRLNSSH